MRGSARVLLALALALSTTVAGGCATTEPQGRLEATPERADAQRRCSAGSGAACAELGASLAVPNSDDSDFERGIVLLEVACGQQTPRACATLAGVYLRRGTKADQARARDLATRGCARREAESCTAMGEVIRVGDRADFTALSAAFRDGCRLGDARGCELFGLAQWDDEVAGDKTAGQSALERACSGGRLTACHTVGMLRLKDDQTRGAGWQLLTANCRNGHAPSCSVAAYASAPLISASPSCAQALPFADQACSTGDHNACAVIMSCRLQTLGDDAPTTDRLHDACIHRVPLACLYWADHEDARADQGPPPDRILYAYRAACRGGFPAASVACARAAAITLARAQDVAEAEGPISVLQETCGASSREACCALGEAYRDGKGVAKDPDKARDLRAKACALGLKRCCETPGPADPHP